MMNKRNLVLQTAVAAALVAAYGVAQATTIGRSGAAATIGAYAGSYTIAAESTAANYAVDLNSATATVNEGALADRAISGTIRWIPTFGLNTGDVCTFTLTNAKYMSADVKLLGEEAAAQQPNIATGVDINGDADKVDVVEVASNFGTVDTTNGVSSVQVRINNGLNLPTGINLVLAKNVGVDAGSNGVLDDETMNPVLRIPAGTGAGNVTIASSCTTSGGLAIGAAAASNTIIDLETQFAMSMTGATSVADVGAATPRTKFVEEGGAGDVITSANDTDLTASAALYTFNNDSDSTVEDFITLVAGDTLTFTLTSSTNLDALATGVGASYVEAAAAGNGTTNDPNFAFTLTSPTMASAAIPGTSLPARGAAAMSDDVVISVDGTTIITDRTFTGSAALNFAAAQDADQTYNLGTTHTWTTNGTVLQTPWFSTASGYVSRFVLTNTGSTAAPFTIALQGEASTTITPGSVTSGTIPANGTLVVNASDVATLTGNTRATAVFTINAPKSSIHGVYNIVNAASGSVSVNNMVTNNGTNADH